MQIVEKISSWATEFLPDGVFLVETEYKPGSGKLAVFLDADQALTIEQCRQFNKFISEKLDELDFGDNAYTLEVSSPGVDRPLKQIRQYPKHLGRELEIKLKAQTLLTGKLLEMIENGIRVQLKDPKKAYKAKEPILKDILFDDILETKVLVSFS